MIVIIIIVIKLFFSLQIYIVFLIQHEFDLLVQFVGSEKSRF